MEHMQNCKKWFELKKTWLDKSCTIDKLNSEGRPNICGMQTATKPAPALPPGVTTQHRFESAVGFVTVMSIEHVPFSFPVVVYFQEDGAQVYTSLVV
jgi:hypothetical protein